MRLIKRKLQSDVGATLIFAVAGLLVATIAALTMVATAANNMQRVRGQQSDQRQYLAVNSAVTLLSKQLGGTVKLTYEVYKDGNPSNKLLAPVAVGEVSDLQMQLVKDMMYWETTDTTGSKLASLRFDQVVAGPSGEGVTPQEDDIIPAVTADLSLEPFALKTKKSGKITAQFRAEGSPYTMMTVTIPNVQPIFLSEKLEYDVTEEGELVVKNHSYEYTVSFNTELIRASSGAAAGG